MRTKFYTERIALYVPSTTEANKAIDNKKQVEKVLTEFCQMYGGATCTQARGGWLSKSVGLVLENVSIIYANCTKKARRANMHRLLALAVSIKNEMKQESVTIEINNKIAFI